MNYIGQKYLDRRAVIRGAAGAALALPLLDAMTPAMANAQAVARAAPPRRVGFVYFPHGCIHEHWTPREVGAGYTMTAPMETLAPNRQKLSVISGLACDPSKTRQGFHDRAIASFMTGVEKSRTEFRVGQSIDQLLAPAVSKDTAFASLELSGEPISPSGGCIFRTPTQPVPVETNPRSLFERLFGDLESVDPASLARIRERQQSMLDLLSEEVGSLQQELGGSDRRKLEEYLDSVRDIERRLAFTDQLASQDLDYERPAGTPASYSERIKVLFDLQMLALRTDMTRVFTFMMNAEASNMTFPEIGWNYSHHMTSHHMFDPEKMAAISRINTYQADLFNYFLTKLDTYEEEDGTLLDNSLIMYASSLGDASNHMHIDLPVYLAGGGAMGMKHDRHLVFPQETPITNLYLSMAARLGVELESFGDSTGPLADV